MAHFKLKTVFIYTGIIACFILNSNLSLAQQKDCYPNCQVTERNVLNERVPLFTSVTASGNHCDADIITSMQTQFENEDKAQMTLLRNQYCSAISGWEQVGECEHGGPPPCCPYTGPNPPWINIGSDRAKSILMAKWHKLQNDRHTQIQNALNSCLASLTSDRTANFNLLYSGALSCLSALKDNAEYMRKNSNIYNRYVGTLNLLHGEAQGWINENDPDNLQNVINTLIPIKNEICNIKLPDPSQNEDINNGVKVVPKPETMAVNNSGKPENKNSLNTTQNTPGNGSNLTKQQQIERRQQQQQRTKDSLLNAQISYQNSRKQMHQEQEQQLEANKAQNQATIASGVSGMADLMSKGIASNNENNFFHGNSIHFGLELGFVSPDIPIVINQNMTSNNIAPANTSHVGAPGQMGVRLGLHFDPIMNDYFTLGISGARTGARGDGRRLPDKSEAMA